MRVESEWVERERESFVGFASRIEQKQSKGVGRIGLFFASWDLFLRGGENCKGKRDDLVYAKSVANLARWSFLSSRGMGSCDLSLWPVPKLR